MKKIYTIIATVAAVLAAASCNKETPESGIEPAKVMVNISVANPEPDTRAVKKGWSEGDIIHVYLDDASNYVPDFDLTYDGSEWKASELSEAVVSRLKESDGKLHGFWEGSNSCMTDDSSWKRYTTNLRFNTDNAATTGTRGHLITDFYGCSYKYDKTSGMLTADIGSWRFLSSIQIVVSDCSYTAGRYTLYCDWVQDFGSFNPNYQDSSTGNLFCKLYYHSSGENGRLAGINNADGVAFVGNLMVDSLDPNDNLSFYLLDNTTGKTYVFSKTITEQLKKSDTKVIAIKIPFAKFEEVIEN